VTAVDQMPPGQSTRNHEARLAAVGTSPASAPEALLDATADARPVFPWRPLVLVLATVDAPDGWADAVALVDDLQDLDVDARLALPSEPDVPSRWVRPARASEATLRTLRPDVVVAWDGEAVAAAERWATGLRTLTIIERSGEGTEVDVVPWRIGRARGRVRGRFAANAAARDLAPLVHRLAAGPHPEAPDPSVVVIAPRRPWDVLQSDIGMHHHPRQRSCAYVVGAVPPASKRAAEAFAGHLGRANVHVSLGGLTAPTAAAAADLVVLQGVAGDEAAHRLAGRRGRTRTVFVLEPGDVGPDGQVRPDAVRLANACGAAIAPTDEARDLLRGVVDDRTRVITVARLMAAERYRALIDARLDRGATLPEVIAWAPATDEPVVDAAIEQALTQLLDTHPSVSVDMVGDGRRFGEHPLVRRLSTTPSPARAARWSVFVTANGSRPPLHVEPPVLAEVGVLGVPTVVPSRWAPAPGRVRVDAPEQASSWLAGISHLVEEVPTREELAFEVTAAAECLQCPEAADALVNRFLGWLDRGRAPGAGR
jgi:hypothetical protein